MGDAFALVHVIRLTGLLDLTALQRAVSLLLERHEPLRTVVRVSDGVPYQVVLPSSDRPVHLVNADDARESDRLVDDSVHAMTHGTLAADSAVFRCVVVRETEHQHTLVLGVHHIAFDGWSASLMLGELGRAYTACTTGREPSLPPLEFTYGDYATWQRGQGVDPTGSDRWRRALSSLESLQSCA